MLHGGSMWEPMNLNMLDYSLLSTGWNSYLMLGHMFNIINGNAPTYLISGINMNQHRYSTRARELSCVIPRVKSSGLTSFMYQGVCHWNNLPLEINQCPSKDTFKYQVKCLLYRRLFVQETSLYVRS